MTNIKFQEFCSSSNPVTQPEIQGTVCSKVISLYSSISEWQSEEYVGNFPSAIN